MHSTGRRPDQRQRFALHVGHPDSDIDLAEAALLIAAEEYPRLDMAHYTSTLDQFGDGAREYVEDAMDASDYIGGINRLLFDELGFTGNRKYYYDPRNSFLNEVIDRRTGIPITLTLVYIEIARRVGFPMYGVGLPGHFIAAHQTSGSRVFVDPFNKGRVLGEAGCAEIVSEMSGLELRPEHLAPVSPRPFLTRMLSNLLNIYTNNRDYRRAVAAIERILLINPASPPYVRDYGLLLAADGQPMRAIEQLTRYLSLAPEAPDTEAIRLQISSLREARARLN